MNKDDICFNDVEKLIEYLNKIDGFQDMLKPINELRKNKENGNKGNDRLV